MRAIASVLLLCVGVACGQDWMGAACWYAEHESTNEISVTDGKWSVRDIIELSCGLDGVVRVSLWNVPDCDIPTPQELADLATNATVLAWAKEKLDNAPIVIEPPNDNTRYGTAEKPIKELYVSSNTLHVGTQRISSDADGIKIKASATGSGWKANGQVQERLEAIERILGLRP